MAALCWSSREEIAHAQGKRNPSKMVGVARGHQRADTLKPYSQKTSQSNHTRTTALSNSMKLSHAHGATQDGQAWWRGLTQCGPLEKEMATHFSVLAWRIPGTGEPGGLPSMGSHRVGHDWSDLGVAVILNLCPFKITILSIP